MNHAVIPGSWVPFVAKYMPQLTSGSPTPLTDSNRSRFVNPLPAVDGHRPESGAGAPEDLRCPREHPFP